MIPKRIFFYWGNETMSWMRYMTLKSFRLLNPDWEVVLYISKNKNFSKDWDGNETQDFINYTGHDYFSMVSDLNVKIEYADLSKYIDTSTINPIQESDMFRYYELYTNGGIYCDMDVLFFRPIDEFYLNLCDNNIDTLIHQTNDFITIGFLGASKGNPFFKDIFNFAINNVEKSNYQSMGVDLIYKMYDANRQSPFIIDKIKGKYPNLKIENLPSSLIYQYDWTKIKMNFSNNLDIKYFSKTSIGYHWFGGSPISQEYNSILNEVNYSSYSTTFSELTKHILK